METNQILRIYGTNYKEMTIQLLEASDLAGRIHAKLQKTDPLIGIKPNLVCPTPAVFGATTHPEIVAGIIEYLQLHGFCNIMICEGSWVGDQTSESFEYCGYNKLAEEYHVRLFDTQKDSSFAASCDPDPAESGFLSFFEDEKSENGISVRGKGSNSFPRILHLCSCLKEIDFLINVPVLKGHCQTKVTCALKNMKGLIPNTEKRRFHSLGLHRPIALLNTCIRQDFIVIDHICGDPDFEEGGNPLVRNCIMSALDPVLTDAYACRILGYLPEEIEYICLAEKLGAGSADLSRLQQVTLRNASSEEQDSFYPFADDCRCTELAEITHKALQLNYATQEIDSCSACYSALTGALNRLQKEGVLHELTEVRGLRFCIGQGYRGQHSSDDHCIGIGTCTGCFQKNIPGCPPTEDEIFDYLTAVCG